MLDEFDLPAFAESGHDTTLRFDQLRLTEGAGVEEYPPPHDTDAPRGTTAVMVQGRVVRGGTGAARAAPSTTMTRPQNSDVSASASHRSEIDVASRGTTRVKKGSVRQAVGAMASAAKAIVSRPVPTTPHPPSAVPASSSSGSSETRRESRIMTELSGEKLREQADTQTQVTAGGFNNLASFAQAVSAHVGGTTGSAVTSPAAADEFMLDDADTASGEFEVAVNLAG